ncbi:MAG TPA: SDR family NAD(P)-dependent oxidoreductase [Ohtaekwangia sp.]|uniref:SDR family oxidoreductase n=1 Tax=Ohtaekwangia sp. TaxID=2066019 RepID=UPI002F92CA3A
MNKLIVVTGGTKGIGRAIVEKFAAQGFDIVTCARNEKDLDELKRRVEADHAVQVFVRAADMSDREAVKNFCAFVTALQRPVDILVNNAGYFIPGDIATEKEGTLESMIHANLYSAYYTTRGLITGMRERKQGYIFNMCSIASIKAYPNGGSYAISKFALLGFSKCLREELKPFNIRVTAIMPGATLTASWEGVDLPEERFMKAEDVAEAVYGAYSLSDRSVVEEIIIRPQLGDI